MLLTPPSAHHSVVAQNASEKRAVAAERREQALAAKLVQERALAVECKRQQLQLAQRERETYLAQVRAFFDMASADRAPDTQDTQDKLRGMHRCSTPSSCPTVHRAQAKISSSLEKRPILVDRVSKSQPGWSEVSTAAPSTVGEEDPVDACMTPAESDIGVKLSASLRAWLDRSEDEPYKEACVVARSKIPEEMESSSSLQQLELALAGEIKAEKVDEKDPLDETLSSSEDDEAAQTPAPAQAHVSKRSESTRPRHVFVRSSNQQYCSGTM